MELEKNNFLSLKFDKPEQLIGLALKAIIQNKPVVITLSKNDNFTQGAPDYVTYKDCNAAVWVVESKF